ncbi:MAG TPA: hypothetical protein VGL82_02835 [Bryobacteraceae bacterium]
MPPLEPELLLVPPHDRNCAIVARHYGLDGGGGANFQVIGNEVGLTRERVRQIVSENDPRHYFRSGGMPVLDHVIAAVAANLPAPAESLEVLLQAQGLTRSVFRLEGIIEIAALLRRPMPFRITNLNGMRFVVAAEYPRFRHVVTAARERVRRYGVANLAACRAGRSRGGDVQREIDLLETVLTAAGDFRWLNRREGWFWFSEVTTNRVVSRIRKMLAVANPLTTAEIRAGLGRMLDPLAPDATLLELCRQLPGLSVDGDRIRTDAEIKVSDVLNKTERDIFRLLAENNGCMSNSDLICRSRGIGVKRPTLYQCVSNSPIVLRHNRNYYRLIGWGQVSGGAALS